MSELNRDDILQAVQGERCLALLQAMGCDLRRKGREYVMLCPFHDDHKPSFTILLPGQKSERGIFKCFVCGQGDDVFGFVQKHQSISDFRDVLRFMADKLGLAGGGAVRHGAPIEKRAAPPTIASSQAMNPREVLGVYKSLRQAAVDPAEAFLSLGLDPRAAAVAGDLVVRCRRGSSGTYEPDPTGTLCVVAQMRSGDAAAFGELCSLRFCSVHKEPGEKRRRWSLDVRDPVDRDRQARHTISGLLAPNGYFIAPPREDQFSLVVEGETTRNAAYSMLIDHAGADPEAWPARVIGLPGSMSCREMLTRSLVGGFCVTFTDNDAAGRMAVFDRRPRACELCGRRVVHGEFCRFRERGSGRECGGYATLETKGELIPGLLSMLNAQGVRSMAAFPPQREGGKQDLRDLRIQGWTWTKFEEYVLSTGTKRTRP